MSSENNINWNAVVTNAVSALVATVFIGAAALVWNAATSIDEQVSNATASIVATQQTTAEEVANLKLEINQLQAQIKSLNKVLRGTKTAAAAQIPKDKPFVLNEYKLDSKAVAEQKKVDSSKYLEQLQLNKMLIQQKLPQK